MPNEVAGNKLRPAFVDTGTVVVDKNNLKNYREGLPVHAKPM